jgi:tetratricopeptide (TPR) repeat protein
MTFWVQGASAASVRVSIDGEETRVAAGRAIALPGDRDGEMGVRFSVKVSPAARQISISASNGHAPFRLTIVPEEFPPSKTGLYDALCRWKEDRGETAKVLAGFADDGSPAVRAKANAIVARFERGMKDFDGAIERFERAIKDAREAGLVADELATTFVLARSLIDDRRSFARAERLLDQARPLLDKFPVGRAMEPYLRALASSAVGDLHNARKQLELSERRAERLDLQGHLSDVYQKTMDVLNLLGRHEEARGYAEKLEKLARLAEYGPCQDAQRATNLGWYTLLSDGDLEIARSHFMFALNANSKRMGSGEPGCNSPVERANVLLNLAYVAIEMGRLDQADGHLAEARGDLSPSLVAFRANLEGRLALARNEFPGAIEHFDQAAAIGAQERLPRAEVVAAFGRAEAFNRLGRRDDALAAYRLADDKLNRWSTLVPLGGGKQTFFGRHDTGTLGYLALLLDGGEVETAACVARRNRSRIPALVEWIHRLGIAPSAERKRWIDVLEGRGTALGVENDLLVDRAAAEVVGAALTPSTCVPGTPSLLDPPAEGEAILVYHPIASPPRLGRETWVGFAITRSSIVARLVDVDPAWLSRDADVSGSEELSRQVGRALLEPFAGVLEQLDRERADGATPRVRLAPAESMAFLPLHRLPVGGRPLEDRFSVVYGVDLPVMEKASTPAPSGSRRALVVDAQTDLHRASTEAHRVKDLLERSGWEVRLLSGGDATREAVLSELSERDLFHYTGHGHANGPDGWDDSVDLARGQSLRVQDVLSLPRVPRFIVLSACKGAASLRDAPAAQAMSLAHAFVIAGGDTVVAARWLVGDAVTEKVMSRLYEPGPGLLDDPATALRRVLQDMPGRGNADFRVLTR